MKNKIESYLSKPATKDDEIIGSLLGASLATIIIVGLMISIARDAERQGAARAFSLPEGASTELSPTVSAFNLVYQGQKEPQCPGDIEKVIPLKDANGNFRGLNVICKPAAGESGK